MGDTRWVAMGRLAGPFGVQGEARITPLTEQADALLPFTTWWLGREETALRAVRVEAVRRHGAGLVARLAEFTTPEAVSAARGVRVWIQRDQLPPPGEDEYYWSDLVGCRVVSDQGEAVGVVESLFATGANDVLVVRQADGGERLLPFTREVAPLVDVPGRCITVHLLPGL